MLALLETNVEYKKLKEEIIDLFPFITAYEINSLYSETLRGQIKKVEHKKIVKKIDFKWKKLYYKNPQDKNHFKRYLIKLPNFLEIIVPDELSKQNLIKGVGEIEKFLALVCREKAYSFEKVHAVTVLVLWDLVGRFRCIEKDELFKELKNYADIEQDKFDKILRELKSCGIFVKLNNEYGIRRVIKL